MLRNNNPVLSHHHPQYHALEKVERDAVMTCDNTVSTVHKEYFDPSNDFSVKDKINP